SKIGYLCAGVEEGPAGLILDLDAQDRYAHELFERKGSAGMRQFVSRECCGAGNRIEDEIVLVQDVGTKQPGALDSVEPRQLGGIEPPIAAADFERLPQNLRRGTRTEAGRRSGVHEPETAVEVQEQVGVAELDMILFNVAVALR